MEGTSPLAEGDICTFQRSNGAWSFFWILKIDPVPNRAPVFSLRKFDAHTNEEVRKEHLDDVAELKGLRLLGHFPITEEKVRECRPQVIGSMPVDDRALEGYKIWREAFDRGEAGVFTLAVEEI